MTDHRDEGEPRGRWRLLAILATAQLLSFAPWFSASAVAPLLSAEWRFGRLDLPFLAIAVHLGFAAGALALAAIGAAALARGDLAQAYSMATMTLTRPPASQSERPATSSVTSCRSGSTGAGAAGTVASRAASG